MHQNAYFYIKLWKKNFWAPPQTPLPLWRGHPSPNLTPWPAATRFSAPAAPRTTVPPALPVHFKHWLCSWLASASAAQRCPTWLTCVSLCRRCPVAHSPAFCHSLWPRCSADSPGPLWASWFRRIGSTDLEQSAAWSSRHVSIRCQFLQPTQGWIVHQGILHEIIARSW